MNFNYYIKAPKINTELIPRERLIQSLIVNNSKQLVLISSPAGYGKTSLLLQYIHSSVPDSYIWIQGTETIRSPYTLIKLVLTAFKSSGYIINDAFFSIIESYETELSSDDKILDEALEQLVIILCSLDLREFKFIIDDYQLFEQNDDKNKISNLISKLLKNKIEGLNVILSSREEFNLPTAKLEAKRNIFRINTSELAFSDVETLEAARAIYQIELTDSELNLLQETVNGWISAIHIIFQKGKTWQAELETVKKDDIFRYFSEDIFIDLDEEVKRFIIATSLLDSFNEEESDRILNIISSGNIIRQVIKKKVFIESFADENGKARYSYQKLFKEFLTVYNTGLDTAIYIAIAKHYQLSGNLKSHIYFLLKAGLVKEAICTFSGNTIKLICDNNLVSYDECLEVFTHEDIDDKDFMFYHSCRLELFKGLNIKEHIDKLRNLNSIYLSDFDVNIILSEFYLLSNNYDEAQKILSTIKDKYLTEETKQYINYLLARVYFRIGPDCYDKAIELCIEETSSPVNNLFRSELYGLLGNIYKDKGNLLTAMHYYESSLQDINQYLKYVKQLGNIVELHSILGNYEKSYSYLNILISVTYGVKIVSLNNIVLRAQINFYNYSGDFTQAIHFLENAINNTETLENPVLLMSKYIEMAQAYWSANKITAARDVYLLAEKIYAKIPENRYFAIIIDFVKDFIADNSMVFKNTEQSLLNAINWHKKNNVFKPIGYFLLYISELYLKSNNYQTSFGYLCDAIENLNKYSMYSFLENRILPSRALFDLAISQNLNKKLVKEIGERFISRRDLPFLREEYLMELNGKIARFIDISFRCFGNTELYLRGDLVAEDKWIRKKSKILLAYLMCDPQKIHTKDKIIDMFFFFDDMPADKADMAYHSAIYNIRTALKIYDIKSDKPKRSKDKTYDYNPQYILYEDKSLRLNPDFFYTSDNVEFEKLYNKIKLPSLSIEEKITNSVKAIEMYKGDFLPGYYDSWCEELRVKYKNMFITLCEELIKLLENDARYEEVVKYSELLLNEDRLSDSTHISIINACVKLGNIKLAKSRFEIMLKIYDDELDEKPQPKTLEKITHILSEAAGPP
ncbi:MAG TPA: BTAD domain-containing putative transcriptional regulator [Ignavibacteria bacterium]|nr:BTAD domain-containing putative transcriptional regulator [Ignavibacteria bacterium]